MRQTARKINVPVRGMDCAGCARSVQRALSGLEGVEHVEVLLGSEKAVIDVTDGGPGMRRIRRAVKEAGYKVPESDDLPGREGVSKRMLQLFGLIFVAVLLVVVAGEIFGLFDWLTTNVPWYAGVAVVLAIGFPVFKQVVRSALRGRIIAHTLMAVGATAALLAGEWVTAAVVVFFMRMGDYAERFATDQARESVRSLTQMAPKTARVVRDDGEHIERVDDVVRDDVVLVRPGENIPVDGEVLDGHATIDQSAITGESMPVEAVSGSTVYAATIAQHGVLKIRATAAGRDSTFGRVIRMVEDAERHKGDVQRYADRFSTYYLPLVAVVAGATYLLGAGIMATVAVLVVACSCAFALATPAAIIASVGAAAKKGLLIKGGRYIESLASADVVLVDKTGTLTVGRPEIAAIECLNGYDELELLRFAAAAEKHSEHPLADAVRRLAAERGIEPEEPSDFHAIPGSGVRAVVNGRAVTVGTAAMAERAAEAASAAPGKTLLYVDVDGKAAGVLAATDAERPDVPGALAALRDLGLERILLLTGDREDVAAEIAGRLGVDYRAELLPEDKIDIVREFQSRGLTVVMIGDGVNDAPALAQADVGIAMAVGTDVAIEAAHIALMRDDWDLIPLLFSIVRRTMGVVRLNIAFTAAYNAVGLALAAFGYLPPIYAAAAQSLPDIGIMANSARLIRQ